MSAWPAMPVVVNGCVSKYLGLCETDDCLAATIFKFTEELGYFSVSWNAKV